MHQSTEAGKRIGIISTQAHSLINFRGPLIRDLSLLGAKVFALAPDYTDELEKQVRDFGAMPISFKMNRTAINPFTDFRDTLRLIFLLRKLKLEVAFGYFIKPVIFGTLAARFAGVPRRISMIEGLGYVYTEGGGSQSFKRKLLRDVVSLLYKVSLSYSHKVLFLNDDDLHEFVQAGIVDTGKAVKLGGIGVDLEYWTSRSGWREPVTFLLAARILREKGVEEFVEAGRRIKALYPSVRLVLIGAIDSNPGGLGRNKVREWVKDGLIEWPGHVDMRSWLERTSVFVLPSYREGLPRSTQEAMAMGKPVITTDVPGCRETVVNGVNGFMVPPRDVGALVRAMLRFVETPQLIDSMGKHSRKMAEERFNVRHINSRLISLLLGERI